MSSINPHFTFRYSQPEDYRFSHDSVFMARRVFELLRGEDLSSWNILDLCAGCGIIGLDFLFHLRAAGNALPASSDFLDVQEIYAGHFAANTREIPEAHTRFLNSNYSDLVKGDARYDLILCNPPYFRPGQGGMSPSEFKNRCRFFLDSDFPTLLNAVVGALKPEGRAFLLLRGLQDHEVSVLDECEVILGSRARLTPIGQIRGTDLVKIHKLKNKDR